MTGLTRGLLIAIEGIDGAGKTTQAAALAGALRDAGLSVVASKEPTTGPWGQRIRAGAGGGERLPVADELEAFVADRREHVAAVIGPALERGDVVVVDRYYYSNAAYQGTRGLDPAEIIARNEAFAPRPDLLVVIDVPVPVGLARIAARGDVANEFEQRESLEQCAAVFRALSGQHVVHVDGTVPAEQVTREVLRAFYEGPLFHALCQKPHLPVCEPTNCVFRSRCGYPELGRLSPVPADAELMGALERPGLSDQERVAELARIAAARRG